MANGQIKARVRCTIEAPVGTWGGGMTDVDALVEQVRREGKDIVERLAASAGGRMIGEPEVVLVVLEEVRRG